VLRSCGMRRSFSGDRRTSGRAGAERRIGAPRTADIGISSRRAGILDMGSATSAPSAMFALDAASPAMWPHPKPARRKACLAPRSASRQVRGDSTPNSLPRDSSERSVSRAAHVARARRSG